MKKRINPGAKRAFKRVRAHVGTVTAIARHVGLTVQSVHEWVVVPPQHCIDLERLTDGAVTRYELRPDVFGTAEAARAALDG